MNTLTKKGAVGGAAAAAMLAGSLLTAAPAQAGGPGINYVEGRTYSSCQAELVAMVAAARGSGADVSSVTSCYKIQPHRWLGSFVAHF